MITGSDVSDSSSTGVAKKNAHRNDVCGSEC